jgi:hypothetical protein
VTGPILRAPSQKRADTGELSRPASGVTTNPLEDSWKLPGAKRHTFFSFANSRCGRFALPHSP